MQAVVANNLDETLPQVRLSVGVSYDDKLVSQSFLCGASGTLEKVTVRVQGGPPGLTGGVMAVSLYEHSGTYGTSSVPTGTALAISAEVSGNGLGDITDVDFEFSGANQIEIDKDSYYVWVLDGSAITGLSMDVLSYTGSYGGNVAVYDGSWTPNASVDTIFKVYCDVGAVADQKYPLPPFAKE